MGVARIDIAENAASLEQPLASDQEPTRYPRPISRADRVWRHPLARIGLIGLAAIVAFCFIGPFVYRASPYTLHINHLLQPPSARFPLGTNNLGRNMLARLMLGGQTSLEVGFSAALAGMSIGVIYGVVAGYVGGLVDTLMMRFVDMVRAIPGLFLLLFVDSMVKPSPLILVFLIAGVSWHGVSRLVRGEVLRLREEAYVEAAVALGASRVGIMRRYLFPNAIGTIIVATTFHIADAILAVAGLSFLGLGLPPPLPNWGAMLADSMAYLPQNAWWLVYPPGLMILLTVLFINFVGDGIRSAFDIRAVNRGGV
jgi:peptide/nickel transport system permease protein